MIIHRSISLLFLPVITRTTFFRKTLTADSLILASGADQKIVSRPYISKKNKAEFSYYLPKYEKVISTGKHPLHEIVRHYNFLSKLSSKKIHPDQPVISWREKKPPIPKGLQARKSVKVQ